MQIPKEFLARNVVYRSLGRMESRELGCGAIPKPNPKRLQTQFSFNAFCAVYVLQGTGGYWADGEQRQHLQAGDLLIRPPNRNHWTVPDADGYWHEFFLMCPLAYYEAFLQQGLIQENRPIMHPGISDALIQRCREMLRLMGSVRLRENHEALIEMQRFMLDAWQLDQRQGEGREGDVVERACELLRQDSHNTVGIDALAEELGISFESFRKQFKQRMGISPAAYRNRHRMDQARMMLVNSDFSIAEIASVLGYSDVYAFSKQFKRATGQAPLHFRNTSR